MMYQIVAVFAMVAAVMSAPSAPVCEDPQTVCKCQTPQGLIDLTKIPDTDPFNITSKQGSFYYTFAPCKPFDIEGDCTNVLGCQISPMASPKYNAIATDSKFQYTKNGDFYSIKYFAGKRSTIVRLVCDASEGTLEDTTTAAQTTEYTFDLKTKYACLNSPSSTVSSATSKSSTASPTIASSTTAKSTTKKSTAKTAPSTTASPQTSSTSSSGTSVSTPKTGTTATSPSPKTGTSPTTKTGSSASPKTGTSVSPKTGSSASPKTGSSASPKTGSSASPKTGTSVSPRSTTQGASSVTSLAMTTLALIAVAARILN